MEDPNAIETPESRKADRATLRDTLRKLREIERRAANGEPVYREMAERIEARRNAAADDMIRDALGN